MAANFSAAANLFSYRKSLLKEVVEVGAQASSLLGLACCLFKLAKNLGLAQHHRV